MRSSSCILACSSCSSASSSSGTSVRPSAVRSRASSIALASAASSRSISLHFFVSSSGCARAEGKRAQGREKRKTDAREEGRQERKEERREGEGKEGENADEKVSLEAMRDRCWCLRCTRRPCLGIGADLQVGSEQRNASVRVMCAAKVTSFGSSHTGLASMYLSRRSASLSSIGLRTSSVQYLATKHAHASRQQMRIRFLSTNAPPLPVNKRSSGAASCSPVHRSGTERAEGTRSDKSEEASEHLLDEVERHRKEDIPAHFRLPFPNNPSPNRFVRPLSKRASTRIAGLGTLDLVSWRQ